MKTIMYQFVQVENSHPYHIIIQPSLIEMHTYMREGYLMAVLSWAEKLIATDAKFSLRYAFFVLNGEFELGDSYRTDRAFF